MNYHWMKKLGKIRFSVSFGFEGMNKLLHLSIGSNVFRNGEYDDIKGATFDLALIGF